jgi:CBS domain-containing protein
MSERVYYCFDNDDVEDAAKLMAEHQMRRIPVVNQDKRLVGMIALADLGRSGVSAAMKALGASPSRRTSRGDSGKKIEQGW